jgi:hypothetical protein
MFPGRESSGHFVKKFSQRISESYSSDQLDQLARETGFKQRESKLTPEIFIDTILFNELDNGCVSLNDHSTAIKLRHDVTISKQGLHDRFNEEASYFVKQLLENQLLTQITGSIDSQALSHFTSVNLKDSTRFQLPSELKEFYPGNTGAATGAGTHIQFEFDLLSGKIGDLNVTDALRQDNTDAQQTIDAIEKGSLILRDLGYYAISVFEHIHEKEAYYISRIHTHTNIYESNKDKLINPSTIYNKMKRHGFSYMEMKVAISEKKLPVRLIAELLPKKEVAKRLAKTRKEAKKKGREVSENYKSRARLNLFITNVPQEWLSTQCVRKLYQLRWQIELRFKAWKSFYHLEAVKKMNRYRFECYLYSTLLHIMINWEIAINFFSIIWQQTGKALSILKFFKTTAQHKERFRMALMEGKAKLRKYLMDLFELSCTKLLLEKRNGRTTLFEILHAKVETITDLC